jgi:hypothetical protein
MDGVSAAATIIAIVQAAGMLFQVGKAFHETFIGNESPQRAKDSTARVASIDEFLVQIELFKSVKVDYPAPIISTTATNPGPDLDTVLGECKLQLKRLQKKLAKMGIPPDANKLRKFWGTLKQRLNESDFAQIDATITILLQQLTLYISVVQVELTRHG